MRKLDKRDIYNILIINILFFLILIIIFFNSHGIYGSKMDFSTQHYMIPDYFRKLFYSTKELFPSFAFNLGDGQNIYNFSYYGLLSPIILLSYLFPFVKMLHFMNIVLVIIIILSIILFYKFISGYTEDKNIRLISGLLFLLSAPLIFHTHRHIMFINYILFLLIALFGVEKYVYFNKKALLIISSFLLIMTSYFFSVPALLVIFIYGVYLFIKENNNLSTIINKSFKLGFTLIIPVLMSMVLILPSFMAILNSRFSGAKTSILSMLIPELSFNNTLYYHYSMGLTSIFIFAITYFLFNKEKENNFLSILFLVLIFIPIINYLLNGFMYLNGKVFIPFIPLGILLITCFLNKLKESKQNYYLLFFIALLISLLGCYDFHLHKSLKQADLYYVIDFTLMIAIILLIKRNKKFMYLFLIFPLFICISSNFIDNFEKKRVISNQYNSEIKENIKKINNNDSNLYRTLDESLSFQNANNIRNISEYKNTMYSSLTNKNYKIFTWNLFEKENPYRNDAIFSDNTNILYDTYMGSKYYISKDNKNILGYNKVYDGKYKIYKNDDVFTIGYVNHNLMSEQEFNKLKYPYNIEAIINNTIVKDNTLNNYQSDLKEININNNSYSLSNKNKTSYNIKLDKTYHNEIIIIRFDMDYNERCKVGDTYIEINNLRNLLTCRGWKYHNKNYSFEYVISEKDIDHLNITLSKGTFKINNIKVYSLNYNHIKDLNNKHDNLIIDKKLTKGDNIYGKINTSGGVLSLSIPYDKGFNIYVDSKKVKPMIVNKYMLGFKVSKGSHNIRINYKAPMLKEGKILSVIGLIIFIIIIIYDKRGSKKYEKNINDSSLL